MKMILKESVWGGLIIEKAIAIMLTIIGHSAGNSKRGIILGIL